MHVETHRCLPSHPVHTELPRQPPLEEENLDNSRHREVSGIGTGMRSGGGDSGEGSNREGDSRKGQYSRDKDSRQWRDEGRMREDKSGKNEPLDRFISCGVKHHRHWECPDKVASVKKPGQSKHRILQ